MALAGHILLAAVSVPIAAFAESLLLHKSYPDLFGIYMLLAIGSPGVYLSLTMAPLWIAHGLFLVSSVLSFVTAAVVIPMTVLLVQSYGLRGGAIAFLLAQMVSVITNGSMIYYCEKNDKQR
jgi:O-antigen/teichoic acid export membrane protein